MAVSCQVSVTANNGYVSREHCLIFYDGSRAPGRRWVLRDISTLGTFLRVKPFDEPVRGVGTTRRVGDGAVGHGLTCCFRRRCPPDPCSRPGNAKWRCSTTAPHSPTRSSRTFSQPPSPGRKSRRRSPPYAALPPSRETSSTTLINSGLGLPDQSAAPVRRLALGAAGHASAVRVLAPNQTHCLLVTIGLPPCFTVHVPCFACR